MPKQLQASRTVDELRERAAALARYHAAGDAAARARFEARPGSPRRGAAVAIADAEQVVAREHGFATWRQLEVFLGQGDEEDFLHLACLRYDHHDRPANWQRAQAMLDANPALAEKDIWHAACAGRVEAVARWLDAEPTRVDALGGYRDWPPLLYACYSRLPAAGAALAVVRLLLDRGADPNAHFMWGGQYRFTALTGAFGEGEMGPVNQPPHPEWRTLAELLLAAGADPNDSQGLYDTMFTPGSDCLALLLAHGLDARARNNWLVGDDGELVANGEQTLGYQLAWAVKNHHVDRAKLLIDHGADLGDLSDGLSLTECAHVGGHPELAEYLAAHGARTVAIDAPKRFAGLCMAGDLDAAKAMQTAEEDVVARTQAALPNLFADAAAANRLDAVRVMLAVGFDTGVPDRTALHQAAFHGHLDMARLLVVGGADVSARDAGFAATPLQWALVAGQEEVAAYLASRNIGAFDAALCEDTERLAALLAADPRVLETTIGATRPGGPANADDWQTPLAFAALRDKETAVRWLLDHGADADIRDADGVPLADRAQAAASDAVAAMVAAAAAGRRGGENG